MNKSLLLIALFTLAGAGPAFAEPQVTVHTEYYAIDGETPAALRQSLNQRSPVRQNNKRFDAYTAWQVCWRYLFDQNLAGCGIKEVNTTLEVRFTLPEWPGRPTAPAPLQAHWGAYHEALLAHEEGHMQFGVEAAAEIEQALNAMAPHPSCPAMEQAANGLAQTLLRKYLELEKQYDRDTNHGMANGAVFP